MGTKELLDRLDHLTSPPPCLEGGWGVLHDYLVGELGLAEDDADLLVPLLAGAERVRMCLRLHERNPSAGSEAVTDEEAVHDKRLLPALRFLADAGMLREVGAFAGGHDLTTCWAFVCRNGNTQAEDDSLGTQSRRTATVFPEDDDPAKRSALVTLIALLFEEMP